MLWFLNTISLKIFVLILWQKINSDFTFVRCRMVSIAVLNLSSIFRNRRSIPINTKCIFYVISFSLALLCALCFMHSAELFFSSLSSFLLFHVCIYGFLKSHFFLFFLFCLFVSAICCVVVTFFRSAITRQLSLIGFLCCLCEQVRETLWDFLLCGMD